MKKILVTYATMAGSTAEVAQKVAEEIAKKDLQVEILPISKVVDVEAYAGFVAGGPMIMGWHREALHFLKMHRQVFKHKPLAIFLMAMSLTQTGETNVDGMDVVVDENLPKPPIKAGKLSFRENYARLPRYVHPVLSAIRPVKPISVGIFGGRLEYGRLKWWAVLFAMLIIRAQAGDKRNWPAISLWAARLAEQFSGTLSSE